MRKPNLAIYLIASLAGVACQESNPYKDGSVGTTTASGTSANGTATTAVGTGNPQATPDVSTEASKPADPTKIPSASLTAAGIVCSDADSISKYKVEMEVLCLNGQPTQAFANALATPWKGAGDVNLGLVKSVDLDNVSTFLLMSGFEVPMSMTEALAKKASLNPANIVAGNATLVQSEVKAIPAAGGKDLGGFELTATLRVSVAIVNVVDVRTLTRDFVVLKEGSVVRSTTYLTPGAPDNADNKIANIVSFWISENGTTKIIGVTHQVADNRGQHPTAETTILNLGRQTVIDGYNALMK